MFTAAKDTWSPRLREVYGRIFDWLRGASLKVLMQKIA
jgi:hypothetical protein